MITVVHVITQLELGGAQENTLFTVRHLDRAHFRVALLYGPGGLLDEDAQQISDAWIEPVPNLVRALDPRRDPVGFRDLVRIFRRLRSEHGALGHDPAHFLVHTHSSKAGVLGRLAARAAGVPKIVHTIHGFAFHEGQPAPLFTSYVLLERAAAQVTDAFISVSRANLAEAEARGIVGAHHQSAVIRSGMNLTALRQAGAHRLEARRALELQDRDEVIVSIGNFKPQKDPVTLLLAIAQLAEQRPNLRLLVAGDGELRPQVEQLIHRHGLERVVRLLGWRRDVPQLLAAADVVALASRFEGLPKSAVQAVAAGRPFVGTRVDGTPEIIREGRNGYLVEPNDPEALAQALARALDRRPVDPSDQRRLMEWEEDRMVTAQASLYRTMTGLDPTG